MLYSHLGNEELAMWISFVGEIEKYDLVKHYDENSITSVSAFWSKVPFLGVHTE